MKSILKRIYALTITLAMTITIMPKFNCFAESEWIQVSPYLWKITENGITYSTNPKSKEPDVYAECSESTVSDVIIPESINGLPVTDVDMEDNETVQTLTIPATVKYLTINKCPNMTECNVDDDNERFCSVEGVIYDKDFKILFYYPTGRKNKTFKVPDGIEQIGSTSELDYNTFPFAACKNLENIIFPESLKRIDECAFAECNFEYIEFSGSIQCGSYAFGDNKKLKEVVMSENFQGVSDDTFNGCDSLETIVFLRKEPFKDSYSSVSAVPIIGDSYWYASLFFSGHHDLTLKTVYVPDNTVENYEYALGDTGFHNFVSLSERPKGNVGDINNNGKIDIMDVVDLQKFLIRKRSVTGLNADINEDGQINVIDFVILKRMVLSPDK